MFRVSLRGHFLIEVFTTLLRVRSKKENERKKINGILVGAKCRAAKSYFTQVNIFSAHVEDYVLPILF